MRLLIRQHRDQLFGDIEGGAEEGGTCVATIKSCSSAFNFSFILFVPNGKNVFTGEANGATQPDLEPPLINMSAYEK